MTGRGRGGADGFSLIELMVVMLILGVVTAQMWVVFSAQKRTFVSSDKALEAQEDARLVADLIAHDVRNAGFMVPDASAVSAFDGQTGGNDLPDRLCVSDDGYFNVPGFGESSAVFDTRDDAFQGAAVGAGSAGQAIAIALGDDDIDGDGATDFMLPSVLWGPDGGGVIISWNGGASTHCARLIGAVPGWLVLDPAHALPGGVVVGGAATAVPATIYEVDPPNLSLLRNGTTLATQIEDLQLEFWLDNPIAGAGVVDPNEFPVYDLNAPPVGLTSDMVRRVRIHVIARSPQPDVQEGTGFNRHQRPATANRAAGAFDNFPRRRFTASAMPRNLL